MKFGQFVRRLERGDSSLYITTQYGDDGDDEGEGEDGQLAPCAATLSSLSAPVSSASRDLRYLLAPPLTHLLGDFPLLPPLFASLIPHQYNLWMGHAPRLTSSRLHHDFHCNLSAHEHTLTGPPSLVFHAGQPLTATYACFSVRSPGIASCAV